MDDPLRRLLVDLSPRLTVGEWVFVTLEGARYGDASDLQPIASVSEDEGLTLVLDRDTADRFALAYDGCYRRITLGVHSDLAAVGLTAAVSTALTEAGIAANMIAGYHHDHVLIPAADAERAQTVLEDLAQKAGQR